jgi:hypothetical protein
MKIPVNAAAPISSPLQALYSGLWGLIIPCRKLLMPPLPLLLLLLLVSLVLVGAAATSGVADLLLLLLPGMLGRPSIRSSTRSGWPLPLLAAAVTPCLRRQPLALLFLQLGEGLSGAAAAAAATALLPGLGNSRGPCCNRDKPTQPLLLLLLLGVAIACLVGVHLVKQAAGCKRAPHNVLLLQALLLLLLAG